MDADRTLARITTLTETLTLTITLTLTLFSHSVILRQHFTGDRKHYVKRLVREAVGFNLNGRCFVLYLFCFHGPCQFRVRVSIRRVEIFPFHGNSMVRPTAQFADKETYGQSIRRQDCAICGPVN